jgi:hypothetical protein
MNKNNILLFIIIMLIVVLVSYGHFIFFKFEKEDFKNFTMPSSEQELQLQSELGCKFLAWGPSLGSCAENCMNSKRIGLWDKDGTQCNEDICSQICGLCTDESSCQWIATWSKAEKEKMLNITEKDTTLSKLIPKKLNISGISFPAAETIGSTAGSNIKLFWENDNNTKSFMIHYYNMKRSDNMIHVEYIESGEVSEHSLSNIDGLSKYSVIVYAINEYGISKASNIIIVET